MFSWQTKISMARALLTKNSPFYIQFYVSKYCHLSCRMCNIVQANSDLTPFPPERIERIADNLIKIGAGVILLTGGEPFLRPDIAEIVRILKQKNLDVRLQTAGLYQARSSMAQCFSYGARDINVSLDSLDESLSDYLNGRSGSWRDAIRTISFISQNIPASDSVCALGCVLSPYNIDEIECILQFATSIGWWLSLVPAHITTNGQPLNFRGRDETFRFKSSDMPKVLELITRLKHRKREGATLFDSDEYLDSIYRYLAFGKPSWRHKSVCDSPNLYFAILPDGRFAPCCDFRFPRDIYVYDPDFPNTYSTAEFRQQVRDIVCHCPGCNFGSFPEMTLSARRFSTIIERIFLQRRARTLLRKPVREDELFGLVERIKRESPIYDGRRNPVSENCGVGVSTP